MLKVRIKNNLNSFNAFLVVRNLLYQLYPLSDEFFGHQNYFVDIIRNLCLYLGIFEARVNQRIENTGRFQDCELLRSFSLIYRCQINVHQIDREVIRIGENGKNTRVINILFHNNRYASLIRI